MADLFHIVTGPVFLSEEETAELTRQAIGGRVLAAKFGPSGVWLDLLKSEWAIALLVKMRGLDPEAKGGLLIWGASEA